MKVEHLSAYSGAQFDKHFLDEQARTHQMDIALFEQTAAKCPDKDVKKFAEDTLPGLREHLHMAHNAMVNEPAGAKMDMTPPKNQPQPQTHPQPQIPQ